VRSVFDACFRHGVVARLEWPAGVYDDGWAQRLQLCGKSLPCIEDGSFSQTRGQCPGQNLLWLLRLTGYSLSDSWVKWGLALYFFAGACWLPVVWMQVEMRDLARAALETEKPLPERYWRRDRWWTVLGSLAFPAIASCSI
jgi:hypothetical protein